MSDNLQVTRQRGKNQMCSYIIYIYIYVCFNYSYIFYIYFYYFYVCWSGWEQHLPPLHKGRPGWQECKTSRIVQPRMPPMKYNIVVRNTRETLHNEHTRITHLEQTDLIFVGPVCIFGCLHSAHSKIHNKCWQMSTHAHSQLMQEWSLEQVQEVHEIQDEMLVLLKQYVLGPTANPLAF